MSHLGILRLELKEGLPKEKREVRGQFTVLALKDRSGPAPKTITLHFDMASLRVSPGGKLPSEADL